MKKFLLLLSAVTLMLAACSKDEKSKILSSIPSETGYVLLFDLQNLNDDLGNKTEGDGKISLSNEFKTFLNNAFYQDGVQLAELLQSGKLAIDYSYGAVFENKNRPVATFYVTDTDKFIDGFGSYGSVDFSKEGDIWFSKDHYIAVAKSQVWMITYGQPFTADEILLLSKLDEKKSVLSKDYFKTISEKNDDIQFFTDIDSFFGTEERYMGVRFSLATILENVKYIAGSANFEKGKAVANAEFLDKNSKPCKMALQLDEVDVNKLNSMNSKGSVFFALNINSATLAPIFSQYESVLKSQLGNDSGLIAGLKNIDGTIGFSMNADPANGTAFDILIPFKSPDSASAVESFASQMFQGSGVTAEGNNLRISEGTSFGADFSSVSEKFKGSLGGVVISFKDFENAFSNEVAKYISNVILTFHKSGNVLQVKLTSDSKQGQNYLISLMQMSEAMKNKK